MSRKPCPARRALAVTTAASVAVALAPAASASPPGCPQWEVEYALSANMRLSDTPFGQGDGVYPVGPGTVVLRFEDRNGHPGGRVAMTVQSLEEHFTVTSNLLLWTTTLVTDARSRATPDACGVAAEGVLAGTTLTWTTPVRGYRADGTMRCTGAACGNFGLPPAGWSELHIGPGPLPFRSFDFAEDMKTFSMQYTFASRTDTPKQTSHVALGGREVRRACLQAAVTSCTALLRL